MSILSNFSFRTTVLNCLQPEKQANGISVKFSGNLTSIKFLQSKKAQELIFTTLSGITILFSSEDFSNAFSPISVIPYGISTSIWGIISAKIPLLYSSRTLSLIINFD